MGLINTITDALGLGTSSSSASSTSTSTPTLPKRDPYEEMLYNTFYESLFGTDGQIEKIKMEIADLESQIDNVGGGWAAAIKKGELAGKIGEKQDQIKDLQPTGFNRFYNQEQKIPSLIDRLEQDAGEQKANDYALGAGLFGAGTQYIQGGQEQTNAINTANNDLGSEMQGIGDKY